MFAVTLKLKPTLRSLFLVCVLAAHAVAAEAEPAPSSAGDKDKAAATAPGAAPAADPTRRGMVVKKKKRKKAPPLPTSPALLPVETCDKPQMAAPPPATQTPVAAVAPALPEPPPTAEEPVEEPPHLTGEWGGARKQMADRGIDVALVYKVEWDRVISGGVDDHPSILENVDVKLSLDAEKLLGWEGLSALVYVLGDRGDHPTERVGDMQGVSNIETDRRSLKIYELWLQERLFAGRLSLLAGLHDLNSEFYVTDTSTLFFNAGFGVGSELGQTGINGPSIFPVAAPAIRVRANPSDNIYAEWALFGAQPGDPAQPGKTSFRFKASDGMLAIGEMAYAEPGKGGSTFARKYGVGFWTFTRAFDRLDSPVQTDASTGTKATQETSHGAYVFADQALSAAWSAFARYGVASEEVNPIRSCASTGVVATGLLPSREADRFGLAVVRAEVGSGLRAALAAQNRATKRAETAYEMSYRIELLQGVALQPDLQYIVNPGANPDLSHATVAGARLEVSL